MKKALLFALVLLTPLTAVAQSVADDAHVAEALEIAEIWLDAQKDYERLPSIAAAIVHDQELVWSGAVGMADIDAGRPATSSTLYSICSISKLFTSVAVMQLRDEGHLDLRDPVQKHLPFYDLEQQYDESTPVTVEGLLTHSAGLPRESDHPYWSGPEYPFPTKDEVIARLSDQETLHPSRTDYQYSNLGLSLAGYIVEEVSGTPYDQYIQSHILGPLGMDDTYWRCRGSTSVANWPWGTQQSPVRVVGMKCPSLKQRVSQRLPGTLLASMTSRSSRCGNSVYGVTPKS